MSGHCEFGVAWRRKTQGETGSENLSLMLDDPFLASPLNVALFETSKQGEANLVWKHQQDADRSHEE